MAQYNAGHEVATMGDPVMNTTIVRYKVKADRAVENIAYIKAVFKTLEASKPDGLRYVSFNLEDGLSFVHIAVTENGSTGNPLTQLDEFRKFVADIGDRCDEPPVASSASIVGSYRLFWQKPAAA